MSQDHLGATFIKRISSEALNSAAINHPYLRAISKGDLPNIDLALKDFAFQYGLYSAQFTHYVSAVIENISNPEHKRILQSNLAEEQGDTHDVELPADVLASVIGQPHTNLYCRFQEALGVDANYRKTSQQCQTGLLWRQQFLQLCKMNEYVGVGAIGIGTELIVSRIYKQVLEGLKKHSNLTMIERVFFDLHSECDEQHAAQMLVIAEDLSHSATTCEKIEHGVRAAIDMRVAFWDEMLERAHNMSTQPYHKELICQ